MSWSPTVAVTDRDEYAERRRVYGVSFCPGDDAKKDWKRFDRLLVATIPTGGVTSTFRCRGESSTSDQIRQTRNGCRTLYHRETT
jgi:hypothetical protein